MRRILVCLLLTSSLSVALAADATTGRVIKVLPLFLNLKGHDALSPSLFDRDAYQAWLRRHPKQRSGIRFDVLWKVSHSGQAPVKLRVQLRGFRDGLPQRTVLEKVVRPGWFRHWTWLPFRGAAYQQFGHITAWRVTLWSGHRLLSEQSSFLWQD